jgi:hypothetical protein
VASRVTLNFDALVRRAAQFADLSQKQIAQTKQRALATLKRRLGPEAARQISDNIMNLTARQISPYLNVKVTADGIVLTGSSSRLPVSAFKPTWGGPSSPGVTVTFWRDSGPLLLPHTFMRRGSKEVWQRVPGARSRTQLVGTGRDSSRVVVREASGLVGRLPIVVRKGPAFARAVYEKKHGDIYPALISFGGQVLSDEAARLVQLFRTK